MFSSLLNCAAVFATRAVIIVTTAAMLHFELLSIGRVFVSCSCRMTTSPILKGTVPGSACSGTSVIRALFMGPRHKEKCMCKTNQDEIPWQFLKDEGMATLYYNY